jgi:hypothetical protein
MAKGGRTRQGSRIRDAEECAIFRKSHIQISAQRLWFLHANGGQYLKLDNDQFLLHLFYLLIVLLSDAT